MTALAQRILALASGQNINQTERQKLAQLAELLEDKEELLEISVREGLACLLYKNLKESGALNVFRNNQRQKLERFYHRTVLFNLRLVHDLKEVLARLNQRGIRIVLLQGIVLLELLYKDVGLRPFTDLDIWVLPIDFPKFERILTDMGYQKDPLYPHTFKRGITTFDVHTHLLGADRISARRLIFKKSQAYIYSRTRDLRFEGQNAGCLDPYDQVLYLGLHALKHNVDRLLWLADIKGLITGWGTSDMEQLTERAGELGQQRSLSYILFLLSHLLDFHPPLVHTAGSRNLKLHPLEKRLLKKRSIFDSLPEWAPLLLFSPQEGVGRRLSFILETLFPRPQILRQVFADSPVPRHSRLYMKRGIQLLGKGVRGVRRRF